MYINSLNLYNFTMTGTVYFIERNALLKVIKQEVPTWNANPDDLVLEPACVLNNLIITSFLVIMWTGGR